MSPARSPPAASRCFCRRPKRADFSPISTRSTTTCWRARSRSISARRPTRRARSPISPISSGWSRWRASIGFLIFSDECYSEIYTREKPPGMLEAAGADFSNVVVFNSLSKRSNLPGAARRPRRRRRRSSCRNFSTTATWSRRRCRARCRKSRSPPTATRRMSKKTAGSTGSSSISPTRSSATATAIARPAGGFFLWLDVAAYGGSEKVALKLWREAGVRMLPGGYLAHDQADGSQSRRGLHPRRHGAGSGNHGGGAASPCRRARLSGIRMAMVHRATAASTPGFCPTTSPTMRAPARCARSAASRLLARRRARGRGARDLVGAGSKSGATPPARRCAICSAAAAPITADLMMQLFGLASIALIAPIATWGWRLLTHRPFDREIWRCAVSGSSASCSPLALPRVCRAARPGRCRPGSAASSATCCCAGRRLLVGGPLGGIEPAGRRASSSASPRWQRGAFACGFGFHGATQTTSAEERRDSDEAEDDEERAAISHRLARACLPEPQGAARAPVHAAAVPARQADSPPQHRARRAASSRASTPRCRRDADTRSTTKTRTRTTRRARARGDARRREPRPRRSAKPRKSADGYVLPALNLLAVPRSTGATLSAKTRSRPTRRRSNTCSRISACAARSSMRGPGPVVTLYELEPAPGIKSSRVIGLCRRHRALDERGLGARRRRVGPQRHRHRTAESDARKSLSARNPRRRRRVWRHRAKLPLCLGKTIGGEPVIVDLTRMPHLLIAGTTGSGKSVAINTMILSLVYRLRPDQCRLIMVDPKMLELSVYDGIPHLLTPVVTDPKKAVVALKWAVREMEDRYKKMSKLGVRNIDGYNMRASPKRRRRARRSSRTVHTGYDRESGEAIYEKEELEFEPLPYLVVIVDEMADLMMVAGKDIEGAIQRLAQMARAAGIHVILATQRPVGRRHHRHHQGELPDPHLIPGHVEDRQPHHPGRAGRRATARPGRHALHGRRRPHQPRARPVRVGRGSREGRAPPQVAGRAAISRGRHRRRRRSDEDGNRCSTAPAWARPATPPTSTSRPCRSCCATARRRRATSSAGCRSATTAPPRSWSGWRQEGVVGQPNHAGKREILIGERGRRTVLEGRRLSGESRRESATSPRGPVCDRVRRHNRFDAMSADV